MDYAYRLSGLPARRRLGIVPVLVAILSASLPGCRLSQDPDRPALLVFAAASLQDLVKDLGQRFGQDQGVELVYNFAGSHTLAQQIEAAPVADVFLSADVRWVDVLERAGRLLADSRRNLVSNRLVVIGHQDATLRLTDPRQLAEADFSFLALANPDGAPAGRYAKAFLQSVRVGEHSLWELLKDRLAPTPDVQAALGLVESDPAIIGIVYRTDAARSSRVAVRYEVPALPRQPIVYCAAAVTGRSNPALARRFLDFLSGPEARAVFVSYGFVIDPSLAVRPDTGHGQ